MRLDVSGMTCPAGCPERVRAALEGVMGTRKVTVDFRAKTATVEYDPGQAKPEQFIAALEKTPYYKGTVHP